jgi:hypothetical protein
MVMNHLQCLQDKQLTLEQIWQGIVKEMQNEQITTLTLQQPLLVVIHKVKADRLNN